MRDVMKFLVQTGIVFLIIAAGFVWLISIFFFDLEEARRAHNKTGEILTLTVRCLVIPLIITMYMLWGHVTSSWEKMSNGRRVAIALVTVPPLPIILYYAVWAVLMLIAIVVILVFMGYAATSPGPDYTKANLIGIQNALDDIKKKL